METRSRRRAEARARRPSPANTRSKRARLPASSSPSASSAPQQRRSSARIQTALSQQTAASPMESSGLPSRRDRNPKQRAEESDRKRGEDVQKKGKQKEAAERERQRQREQERDRILSADGGEGEDNEEEGGAGRFNSEMPFRGNALGLLRKFVAGIEDLSPPPAVWKRILTGLRAEGEFGRQIETLTELCEIVSMGTEDSLSNFSVDSFAPVLVGLLNCESNSDMMLLAARALTHLCDVLPSFCSAAVHYGAVRCLCARLLTIEYMDLAEQSLQALKKISHEHPVACLRTGALMAVLSYLDFFSTGVQRVALSTAANICKQLPSDLADFTMAAVPTLTNLLSYHDSKVVEHASVCLARIVESFATSPQNLDELCNHGLVSQAAQLISANNVGSAQSSISTSTYTGVIRLLSTCTSGSVVSAKTLLDIGISGILRDTLAGPAVVSRMPVPPSLNRSWDQLYEIVSLVNELLPSLPPGIISLPTSTNIGLNNSVRKHTTRNSAGKAEDTGKTKAEISPREKLFHDQPELLARFGMDLFPVVVQVYGSSVNSLIRHKCLAVVSKLSYLSTADMLKSLLRVTNISSFLAGVLSCKDPQVLIPALQIAEVLMKKLPDVFSKMFLKEGVVYAIDMLISSGLSSVSFVQAPTSGKDQVVSIGAVPKIRRNRRHGGISEGTRLEEAKVSISGKGCSPLSQDAAVSGLQTTVSAYAKHFKDTCLPGYSGSIGSGATDSLCKLKSLCKKLNALANPKVKMKGKVKLSGAVAANNRQLLPVVSDIFAELSKGDGVSTFEFVGSGIVASLLNFFSGDSLCKENMSESDLLEHCQQALKRLELFIEVSLPMNYTEGREVPLTILVRKLQDALASLECFPVFLSHAPSSRGVNASMSEGLPALSQHFKLRLCRAQGEKFLRDYSSTVIRINPSASLASVEDFLWPRVQTNESIQMSSIATASDSSAGQPSMPGASSLTRSISTRVASEHRPSTRSRPSMTAGNAPAEGLDCANAGLSKGKGKAASECVADYRGGPQTRNSIRRRAALDKTLQLKQQGETGDEDEDLDVCPHELDETVAMEDDIFDDDDDEDEDEDNEEYERVHDVRLGDAVDAGTAASTSATVGDIASHPSSAVGSRAAIFTESGETGELRTSLGLKGSLSFATSAIAGHASCSVRDARGSRDYQALPLANIGNVCPRLNFFLGGKQLNRSSTVYQAIQCHAVVDGGEERYAAPDFCQIYGRKLWDEVHNIAYQRADIPVERTCIGSRVNGFIPEIAKNGSSSNSRTESLWQHVSLIGSILQGKLSCDLEKSICPYDILLLLRVVESLNHLAPRLRAQGALDAFAEGKISSLDGLKVKGPVVAQEEFLSSKLTPKLVCQMQDVLALCKGNLPSWCHQLTKACPFLFPFETRRHYFYSTTFGLSRALKYMQQQQSAGYPNSTNDRERHGSRLARQKVRVSRNRILESAAKVMEMYAGQNAVLEVEYFGEVGTGLGPTLEFYTLISHELQRSGLGMWRCSYPVESGAEMLDVPSLPAKKDNQEVAVVNGEFVKATLGLFPCPYPPNTDSSDGSQFSKVIDYFRLLGQVIAKALQDGRLLDLPLSTAFYKLVLGQELDLYDIRTFDLELGTTMQEMQALVCRKQVLESISGNRREAISNLHYRGSSIEDLCLDFTLPGYPDYALKPGRDSILVNIDNIEEYVSLVVDATIRTGVMRQIEAFRTGFNQVFPITSLQIFAENELDSLLCGGCSLWVPETLTDNIRFDHGYTIQSPPILNLLEIMAAFTPDQQRAFLQFVTGSPRLPPGGLAALNPKLTIVRKNSSGVNGGPNASTFSAQAVDADLPSVMTCANYLKLPPYSGKEVMQDRLLYAITEGQGSFDLS